MQQFRKFTLPINHLTFLNFTLITTLLTVYYTKINIFLSNAEEQHIHILIILSVSVETSFQGYLLS